MILTGMLESLRDHCKETASSSWKDGLFGLGGGTSSMAEGQGAICVFLDSSH